MEAMKKAGRFESAGAFHVVNHISYEFIGARKLIFCMVEDWTYLDAICELRLCKNSCMYD